MKLRNAHEMGSTPRPTKLAISVRIGKDEVSEGLRPEDLFLYDKTRLCAWRLPPSYKEQLNHPGYFWVSQTEQMVMYESRLEMTILKSLDFEESLDFVLAQPFCLHFEIEGKRRFHIPDFLVWRKFGKPLLVNVKPRKYLDQERNRVSFAACNELCRKINLEHRVCSELEPAEMTNLRWLAGYRRTPYLFEIAAPDLLSRLSRARRTSFANWIAGIAEESLVRPVAFHLMWRRSVEFDRSAVLNDETQVWRLAS